MNNSSDKILTLVEAAELLRVSRHTIQAWMSPSSPNHRPDFVSVARHAGRKTVFYESDLITWLNQRKGTVYSQETTDVSPYWPERFAAGRGLLKGFLRPMTGPVYKISSAGLSGTLGIDLEPLLVWLSDSPGAADIARAAKKSDGLILSASVSYWIMSRIPKDSAFYGKTAKFLFEDNIFVHAPFNEKAVYNALDIDDKTLPEFAKESYASCIAAGASAYLTYNKHMRELKGFKIVQIKEIQSK